MIALDTSAVIAIVNQEPEARSYTRLLNDADAVVVGAPTRFEMALVASNLNPVAGESVVAALLRRFGVTVLDWTDRHAAIAASAYQRFGRGRHPAKLNFGDCMAYAVARALDAPLLFKGGDFALTDVKRVTG